MLPQRRKIYSVDLFGWGCAFLARWMAHGSLAVMQHNAAVSQPPRVLAGGAWHGHSAPAAPARPHPGPGLPLAEAWNCFYLVMLQRDMASGGPGHLPVRVDSSLWGDSLPPSPLCCTVMKGRPAALMQAERAGLRLRTEI